MARSLPSSAFSRGKPGWSFRSARCSTRARDRSSCLACLRAATASPFSNEPGGNSCWSRTSRERSRSSSDRDLRAGLSRLDALRRRDLVRRPRRARRGSSFDAVDALGPIARPRPCPGRLDPLRHLPRRSGPRRAGRAASPASLPALPASRRSAISPGSTDRSLSGLSADGRTLLSRRLAMRPAATARSTCEDRRLAGRQARRGRGDGAVADGKWVLVRPADSEKAGPRPDGHGHTATLRSRLRADCDETLFPDAGTGSPAGSPSGRQAAPLRPGPPVGQASPDHGKSLRVRARNHLARRPADRRIGRVGRRPFPRPDGRGEPRTIPNSKKLDPIRWTPGRKIHSSPSRSGSIPARIVRVDVATGRRGAWKDLAPRRSCSGDHPESPPIFITPDGKSYVYGYGRAATPTCTSSKA